VCGEVVESQVEFDLLKKGDVVFGLVGLYDKPQAYSEYCIGTLSDVVLKPAELSLEEAGALPMVGLTAWQAVMEHGRCEQGQRVLVHAAAGGVGHLAVQFAKSEGAYVIATATAKDHAYLKSIGVDECIDYSEVAFENSVKDMDLIIDLVGGETALRSFACLAPNGRLVTVPTVTRDVILKKASEVGVDATGMKMQLKPKDLIDIGERVASKKLHINIAAKYALADAKEAHIAMSESRHAGKYILQCTQARLL
jgi:NADPH:quinone reductase-like Zn-dependent oxidoreductase